VFVGAEGGDGRANLNRLWQWAAGNAGIDPAVGLHFHDLRHTGNHLTDGASLKDVVRRLGHASTRAALIDQHADRVSERAVTSCPVGDDHTGPGRHKRARGGHSGP
jgi:integrase